jgi:hypothetical protein
MEETFGIKLSDDNNIKIEKHNSTYSYDYVIKAHDVSLNLNRYAGAELTIFDTFVKMQKSSTLTSGKCNQVYEYGIIWVAQLHM